ncbi:hypothetical protein LOZ27_003430 [Ophidiomyces ophidiicola]|nr:hypothetical protein LOZ27_003430 [Ophidiomyces ophidiicola]
MASSSDSVAVKPPDGNILQLIQDLRHTIQATQKDGMLMIDVETIHSFTRFSNSLNPTYLSELESLRELTKMVHEGINPNLAASARKRKVILGEKSIRGLFGSFVTQYPTLARRWVRAMTNIFAYALLTEIEHLGGLILSDTDCVLKLISGLIIQQLLLAGPEPCAFWPLDADSKFTSWLTPNAAIDAYWMNNFVKLLVLVDLSKCHRFPKTMIRCLRSLTIPGFDLNSKNTPIAMVIENDHLTFVAVSSERVQIIDVPINFVRGVMFSNLGLSALQVDLVEDTCYFANGLAIKAESLEATFTTSQVANEVLKTLNQRPSKLAYDSNDLAAYIQGQKEVNAKRTLKNRGHAISAAIDLTEDEGNIASPQGLMQPPSGRKNNIYTKRVSSSAAIEISLLSDSSTEHDDSPQRKKTVEKAGQKGENLESGYASMSPQKAALNKPNSDKMPTQVQLTSLDLVHDRDTPAQGSPRETWSQCGSAEGAGRIPDSATCEVDLVQRQSASPQATSPENSEHDHQISSEVVAPVPANSDYEIAGHQQENTRATETTATMELVPQPKPPDSIPGIKEQDTKSPNLNTSRLKRPNHRISGQLGKRDDVDWDQDLRVEDKAPETAVKAKRQKKTPLAMDSAKIQRQRKSALSTRVKKTVVRMLSLSPRPPQAESAPPKQKAKPQVTKTLAASRQPRAAAELATKKLAAARQEDLLYAYDDPIESSTPAIAAVEGDNSGRGDRNIIESPVQKAAELKSQASDDGANNITLRHVSPFPGFRMPSLQSGEADISHGDKIDICLTLSKQQSLLAQTRKRKSPTPLDNAKARQDSPASKRTKPAEFGAEAKRNWGGKLMATLEDAGICPAEGEQPGNSSVQEEKAASQILQPKTDMSLNTAARSQISRNVSWFIAQQNVKGQRVDAAAVGVSQPSHPEESAGITADTGEVEPEKIDVDPIGFSSEGVSTPPDEDEQHLAAEPTVKNTCQITGNQYRSYHHEQEMGVGADKPVNRRLTWGRKVQQGVRFNTNSHGSDSRSSLKGSHLEHRVELDNSPLNPIILESSDDSSPDENGDDSDASICILSRNNFLAKCDAKGLSNSQSQTVNEKGSPQPKLFLRTKKIEGMHNECLDQKGVEYATGFKVVKTPMEDTDIEINDNMNPASRFNNSAKYLNHSPKNEALGEQQKGAGTPGFQLHGTSMTIKQHGIKLLDKPESWPGLQGTSPKGHGKGLHIPETKQQEIQSSQNCLPTDRHVSEQEKVATQPEKEADVGEEVISSAASSEPNSASLAMEWQKAMRGSQRTTLDMLLDTSNVSFIYKSPMTSANQPCEQMLMRHLLDEESAIANVVDQYAKGGKRIIDQLEEKHQNIWAESASQLQLAQQGSSDVCRIVLRLLGDEQRAVRDLPSIANLAAAYEKKGKQLLHRVDEAAKECEQEEL